MSDPKDPRQIVAALRRAVAPERDDFEHVEYPQLEAYVDDRLAEVDREIVQAHLDLCAMCTEDVADLEAVRAQMIAPAVRRTSRVGWVAAAAAAGIVLAVVISQRQRTSSVVVPATSAATRDDGLRTDERAAIADAMASGILPVPAAVRSLTGTEGTLLGTAPDPVTMRPLAPAGTAVGTASPEFTWQAIDRVASYGVAIFDEQFREVAASGRLTSTRWTPPAPLPRGIVLTWQVKATRRDGSEVLAPAPPHPEARFVVLNEASATALDAQRVTLKDRPLELGILLAQAGLLDEAAQAFGRVPADAPTAATAAKFLATLRRP